jgi:hypothetical protein
VLEALQNGKPVNAAMYNQRAASYLAMIDSSKGPSRTGNKDNHTNLSLYFPDSPKKMSLCKKQLETEVGTDESDGKFK